MLLVPVSVRKWKAVTAVCTARGCGHASHTHPVRPASPTDFLAEERIQTTHKLEIADAYTQIIKVCTITPQDSESKLMELFLAPLGGFLHLEHIEPHRLTQRPTLPSNHHVTQFHISVKMGRAERKSIKRTNGTDSVLKESITGNRATSGRRGSCVSSRSACIS